MGCRAVCLIDATDAYVFLTVLERWMWKAREAEKAERDKTEGKGAKIGGYTDSEDVAKTR